VMVLVTFGAMFIALAVALAMRLSRAEIGAFLQGSFRGNLAFVGLATVLMVAQTRGMSSETTGLAALALAPTVPLYNVLSVVCLLVTQQRFELASLRRLIRPLLTNPLIIACAVGIVLAWSGWSLPVVITRSLAMIGQTAGPLALLGLGAGLVTLPVRHAVGRATVASLIKVAVSPILAFGLCHLLGLGSESLLIATVFAACPTAVASYQLTVQLKGDGPLAAACVVISTVLSMFALAVVLYVV